MSLLTSLSAEAQNHSQLFHFTTPDEKLLTEANELDRQYEKKGLVFRDRDAEDYLTGVGNRLLGQDSPPERVQYKFHILRDPMVNAFALPNGSIYVNTGLIAAMETEAELAAVVAHEITHVSNRHTYLQNRSIRKKAVAMDAIAIASAGASYFPIGAAFGYSVGLASQFSQILIVATVYGYSRDLERDADTTGYGRLLRASYDGTAMAQAFQILDERLEFEPTEPFWRTHPKLQERIATARKMAETENTARPRPASSGEYFDHLAPVIRYNVTLDLDSRRARTAAARAQRLVNWAPSSANRALLADAYRLLGAKNARREGAELSDPGKQAARKQVLKMTYEEEQGALLATDSGKLALTANRTKAEELYRDAITADAREAAPHRGLGMLYQDQGRYQDAANEYREYLKLAPEQAVDRLRIERRLESVTTAQRKQEEK